MPTRQAGSASKNRSTSDRRSFLLSTTCPSASMPWIWKTFFARSRPTMATVILDAPCAGDSNSTVRPRDAGHRGRPPHQESLRALARRYGVNPKTVAKWRKRTSHADLPTGPREPRSTVLSIEEEAVVVAFRRHTLLPLDDCLYALQPTIPHLTRSSLHRCLQRHGIARLPDTDGDKPKRSRVKAYPMASSTSTSPRCTPRRAASISSWPSIAPRSSAWLDYTRKPRAASPATSSDT